MARRKGREWREIREGERGEGEAKRDKMKEERIEGKRKQARMWREGRECKGLVSKSRKKRGTRIVGCRMGKENGKKL
jgi:hypothetical protein